MHSGTKIFQPDPSGRPSSSHHQFVVQNQEDEPDEPDEPKALADRLKLGQGEEMDMIPASLLRKYIAYARRYTQPRYALFIQDLQRQSY